VSSFGPTEDVWTEHYSEEFSHMPSCMVSSKMGRDSPGFLKLCHLKLNLRAIPTKGSTPMALYKF